MNDLRYMLFDEWGSFSLSMNKSEIRGEYRADMDRLISARNMWGKIWAAELYRLRCEDVKAFAYQSALLSCDWNRDLLETRGLFIDNIKGEMSDGYRQRLIDRGLRSLNDEMNVACKIVNAEFLKRGASKEMLRNRHMPLQAFHNIIRSSEAMNDRYLWQNQLIKVYDIKHGWLYDKLPEAAKEMINADCPQFTKDTTRYCRKCDEGKWLAHPTVSSDSGMVTEEPEPCNEKLCTLCQTPFAKIRRKSFYKEIETNTTRIRSNRYAAYTDMLQTHPDEEHLVLRWSDRPSTVATWFVPEDGTCTHERYTRCGCYRQADCNKGPCKRRIWNFPFEDNKDKPCVELHNYNFGCNMNNHAYSRGGHWGFADSGYRPIFGAEMRKLSIISADCGYLLHFCGMRIFLQNLY